MRETIQVHGAVAMKQQHEVVAPTSGDALDKQIAIHTRVATVDSGSVEELPQTTRLAFQPARGLRCFAQYANRRGTTSAKGRQR